MASSGRRAEVESAPAGAVFPEATYVISETFSELPDGRIVRRREMQTELAEWEQISGRCWRRRVKEWKMG